MTYDKEFEEFISDIPVNCHMKDNMYIAWQAARKDHYRIGEEVEAKQIGAQWKKGTVMAVVYSNNNYYIEEPELVRRIPAWTPKEGEAVFYLAGGTIRVGKIMAIGINGHTAVRGASGVDASVRNIDIKTFDAEKIGKPWEEI